MPKGIGYGHKRTLREEMTGDIDPAASDAKNLEKISNKISRSVPVETEFGRNMQRKRSDALREVEASRGGKLQLRTRKPLLDKGTKGSPPFSTSELQRGYRKL